MPDDNIALNLYDDFCDWSDRHFPQDNLAQLVLITLAGLIVSVLGFFACLILGAISTTLFIISPVWRLPIKLWRRYKNK